MRLFEFFYPKKTLFSIRTQNNLISRNSIRDIYIRILYGILRIPLIRLCVAKHYCSYNLSCNLHVCIFHKGVWDLSRNSSIYARVKRLSTLGVATLQPLFEKIQVETHFDRRRSASLLAYGFPLSVWSVFCLHWKLPKWQLEYDRSRVLLVLLHACVRSY